MKTPNTQQIKHTIQSLQIETHWYRRVFHAFGTIFLIYYLIPSDPIFSHLKLLTVIGILLTAILLEILRLQKKIKQTHFFGLRTYETRRPASYVYFGVGTLLLLLFFPQQIAIPCILCACLADPAIGELRQRLTPLPTTLIGFIICFLFFATTWNTAEPWLIILISTSGATAAILGETLNKPWLDDDLLIQLLPALCLFIIWQLLQALTEVQILPEVILHPISL